MRGKVVNFKDNASGQFLFPAFNALSQGTPEMA